MAQRKYYTLAERTDGVWSPQAGDYNLDDIKQERLDRHECWPFPKLGDLRIVTSGPTQREIDAAILALNSLEK